MPAPNARVSFSVGVEALKRMDEARSDRERRMRNALEIILDKRVMTASEAAHYPNFVRRVAREGLGRE